jgi:outer membrane protein assembly factor BamB
MLRYGRAVVLVALVAAQGCWYQTGAGPGRRGANDLEAEVTSANVVDLGVAWTASVDGAAREAVADGRSVYVVGTNEVAAFAQPTGAERWSVDVQRGSNPAIVAGKLRVPVDCSVWSFDRTTGASETRDFVPETVPDGFSWWCTSGDALGLGTQVVVPWTYAVDPIFGGPACPRDSGYGAYGPGLTAMDFGEAPADWGRSDYTFRCYQALEPFPDPGVAPYGPLSSDGAFVLVPRGRTLNAMALGCTEAQCPVAWTVDVGAPIVGPAVALATGDLAVPTDAGRVVVIDGATHHVEWTGTLGAPLNQPLAASSTTIVAAATDGTVAAFPAQGCGSATCAPGWTATLASAASARPSVGGDVVYVGGADGAVTALAADGCGAASCGALWQGQTPDDVTGAPVVSAGTVVVGSADGTVTAFALPGS